MATAREQMKTIDAELERVRAEIAHLQTEEAILIRLRAKMGGESVEVVAPRKRSSSVKPLVLDLLRMAGSDGMTSADVGILVRERVPEVAKDTVGSVLSRLKADGALSYVGERYYEKKFAPKDTPNPFEHLRAVS